MNRRRFVTSACLGSASLVLDHLLPAAQKGGAPPFPPIEIHALPQRKPSPLGMPGLFPGRVVEVFDPEAMADHRVSQPVVRHMLERGMLELTGENSVQAAWAKFLTPADVVGIKINPSGVPACGTSPELIREVIRSVEQVGVPHRNIVVYDRFDFQIKTGDYRKSLPTGIRIVGIESEYDRTGRSLEGYDRNVYWEARLFDESEARSYMASVVSQQVTKIINLPTLKDHSAAGVTGCLKNLSYGSFNNMGRTHQPPHTFTYPLIGMMCAMDPLRSKAVLHIMDGMKQVWHGGPLTQLPEFIAETKTLYLGTDPVAVDMIELESIEAKRRQEGAPSLWECRPESLTLNEEEYYHNPRKNLFSRQPEHIAAAGKLGLGISDRKRIDLAWIRLG